MAWQSRTLISWLRAHLPDMLIFASPGSSSSQGTDFTSWNSSSKVRQTFSARIISTLSAQRRRRLHKKASAMEPAKRAPPISAVTFFIFSRFSSAATMPSMPKAAVANSAMPSCVTLLTPLPAYDTVSAGKSKEKSALRARLAFSAVMLYTVLWRGRCFHGAAGYEGGSVHEADYRNRPG